MKHSNEQEALKNYIEKKEKHLLRSIYKSLLKTTLNDKHTSNDTKIFNFLIAMREISVINSNIKQKKNLFTNNSIADILQDLKNLIDEVQYQECKDTELKKSFLRFLNDDINELYELNKELEDNDDINIT